MNVLTDRFGRAFPYLRLSIIDACNFRCSYCLPEGFRAVAGRPASLETDEIARLLRAFSAVGMRKLRITGGEPLVRRDIMTLFRRLSRHLDNGRLDELTLTTNGSQLERYAADLAALGVRRINVSIDSLDPAKFRVITRRGDLGQVMAGLKAAQRAGLAVKINTVALREVNDDELDRLVAWCGEEGFDLTLIETMPLGEVDEDRTDHYLPLSEVRQRLAERWTLTPTDYRTGGPARYVTVKETGRRLGFITPLTHNFCESCNRVRLTCTGTLYMCLGQEDAVDLRAPLRASATDAELHQAIDRAMWLKPKGHDFVIDRQGAKPAVARHMSVTGG